MSSTTIPVARVLTSPSSIISTVPTATILTTNTNVPVSSVSEIANCRHCGVRFSRPIGSSATCDAYFRCPACRGLASKSFGCVIS